MFCKTTIPLRFKVSYTTYGLLAYILGVLQHTTWSQEVFHVRGTYVVSPQQQRARTVKPRSKDYERRLQHATIDSFNSDVAGTRTTFTRRTLRGGGGLRRPARPFRLQTKKIPETRIAAQKYLPPVCP